MKRQGFTLAELLIALALLGVIATFTIPKVLVAQQNSQFKAVAKETLAMVSGAYTAYQLEHSAGALTSTQDLTPYMNYVQIVTSSGSAIDNNFWSSGEISCESPSMCLRLHSGALLLIDGTTFDGTATTNMIYFSVDPDGRVTQPGSPVEGSGKSLDFFLYFPGRITSYGECAAGTWSSGWNSPTCPNSDPGPDPNWFSWN